jgi:hypothetical protein
MWHSDRLFRRVTLGLVLLALLAFLAEARWVPGHEGADGKRTRLRGWDRLMAGWHDFRMGELGHPDFRADPDAWGWRVRLDPGNPEAARALLESLVRMPEPEVQALELLSEARMRRGLDLEGWALEVIALGRSGRTNESEARWSDLNRAPMGRFQRTMVCLAGFEMHARAGRVEAAMDEYRQIEGKYLMSAQVRWLEQEFLRLGERRKAGEASRPGEEP